MGRQSLTDPCDDLTEEEPERPIAGDASSVPQDQSVLRELRARLGSRTYRLETRHRLFLCIEGGGMRGVVSAGMALALEEAQAFDAFDGVFGASSGAFNAAYFLTKSVHRGINIYTRAATHFIQMGRALMLRPLVDFQRLLSLVAEGPFSIPQAGFGEIRRRLRVVVTQVNRARPDCISNITTRGQLVAALEASSRMPGLAHLGGQGQLPEFVDGSVTDPFGVACACAQHPTLILVLASRSVSSYQRPSLLDYAVIQPALSRFSRELGREYLKRKRTVLQHLLSMLVESHVSCYVVQPPPHLITTIESRTAALERAANCGHAAARSLLAHSGA